MTVVTENMNNPATRTIRRPLSELFQFCTFAFQFCLFYFSRFGNIVKTPILMIPKVADTPTTKYDHVGLIGIFLRIVNTSIAIETKEAERAIKLKKSFCACVFSFSIIVISLAPNVSSIPTIIPKTNSMALAGRDMHDT